MAFYGPLVITALIGIVFMIETIPGITATSGANMGYGGTTGGQIGAMYQGGSAGVGAEGGSGNNGAVYGPGSTGGGPVAGAAYGSTGPAAYGMPAPGTGFGGHGQPAGYGGGYGKPQTDYGSGAGGYSQPPGAYGASSGAYNQPPGSYGASAGGYGQPSGSYGASAGGYGQPPGSYGASAGGYGKPQAGYGGGSKPQGSGGASYGASGTAIGKPNNFHHIFHSSVPEIDQKMGALMDMCYSTPLTANHTRKMSDRIKKMITRWNKDIDEHKKFAPARHLIHIFITNFVTVINESCREAAQSALRLHASHSQNVNQ